MSAPFGSNNFGLQPLMAPAAAPAGSLEERISTLLSPFRKIFTAANAELAALEEKKVTVLSQNIAFLMCNHATKQGYEARAHNIKFANYNFFGSTDAVAPTYINVYLDRSWNAHSHPIVKVKIEDRDQAMDVLLTEVDKAMKGFFPDA